jgi:hypothetical protein
MRAARVGPPPDKHGRSHGVSASTNSPSVGRRAPPRRIETRGTFRATEAVRRPTQATAGPGRGNPPWSAARTEPRRFPRAKPAAATPCACPDAKACAARCPTGNDSGPPPPLPTWGRRSGRETHPVDGGVGGRRDGHGHVRQLVFLKRVHGVAGRQQAFQRVLGPASPDDGSAVLVYRWHGGPAESSAAAGVRGPHPLTSPAGWRPPFSAARPTAP